MTGVQKLVALKVIGLALLLALAFWVHQSIQAGPWRISGKFTAAVPVRVVEVKNFSDLLRDLEEGKDVVGKEIHSEVQNNTAVYSEVARTRSEAEKVADHLREMGCWDVTITKEKP